MKTCSVALLALLAAASALPVASAVHAAEAASEKPVPAAAVATIAPTPPGEPAVQRAVLEDDGVRIEETRVRGQVTRVVVRSKQMDLRPYEVLVGTAARDPSQRGQGSGQRVWHIFSF